MGDIFTIYELEHGVDFNVALWALAEQLGTSVEPHSTKPARKCPPAPSPVQSGSAPKDMSDYFAACRARLHDPAAVSFLSARGINIKTAETYGLGFGPKADPAGSHRCCPRITIPTNCFHYVARSIDPDAQPGCRTMNSLGVSPTLFNRQTATAAVERPATISSSSCTPVEWFSGTSARTSAVRRGTQTSRCRQTSRGSLSLFKVLKRKQ